MNHWGGELVMVCRGGKTGQVHREEGIREGGGTAGPRQCPANRESGAFRRVEGSCSGQRDKGGWQSSNWGIEQFGGSRNRCGRGGTSTECREDRTVPMACEESKMEEQETPFLAVAIAKVDSKRMKRNVPDLRCSKSIVAYVAVDINNLR